MKRFSVAIVGDFDHKMHTHIALNKAIEHCRPHLPGPLTHEWIATKNTHNMLNRERFGGFWIAPGSPYADDAAVYEAIGWARTKSFPLFGMCGGFQYMVIEFARNVLGQLEASHAESDPDGISPLVIPLACSLKGKTEKVMIPDTESWLFKTLGVHSISGHYFCSYGVRRDAQQALESDNLAFTAFSPDGEARALELKGHPFFMGTLFQPSLDSTTSRPNPLILDFLRQCVAGGSG